MRTAIVAGATGLIGFQLLELLINEPAYDKVIVISRKPLTIVHYKVQNIVINFDNLADHADQMIGDDVFCSLGTTIKQAGSKEVFRKVDLEYPVNLAKITKQRGAHQFFLITALGADRNSSIFYNKVKGEVEAEVRLVNFSSYHIFQPSMLIGERKDSRAGENIGQKVMKFLDFAIPQKYKAIDSLKVARAMLKIALLNQDGNHIHVSGEIQSY